MVCHGRLAASRPAAKHATAFYLAIALGGVLGGAFNSLFAPLVFDRLIEYPLAVVLACLVCARSGAGGREHPAAALVRRSPASGGRLRAAW